VHEIAGIGGILAWVVNTAASAVVGLIVGFIVVAIVSKLPFGKLGDAAAAH
jgi:predicted DNA repair protein MutK